MSPATPFSMSEVSGFHADPVVPILLALVLLTLAAVFGGRLSKDNERITISHFQSTNVVDR
jgi:hypothetical protein